MSFLKSESKSEKWKRVEFSDLRDGNFASCSSGFLLPPPDARKLSLFTPVLHTVICEELLPLLLTCELSFVPPVVHGVVCGNISKINLEDFSSPYLFQILLWNRFGASNTACNTSNTSNILKLYLSSLFVDVACIEYIPRQYDSSFLQLQPLVFLKMSEKKLKGKPAHHSVTFFDCCSSGCFVWYTNVQHHTNARQLTMFVL